MAELKLSGNHLKGSRPVLSFHKVCYKHMTRPSLLLQILFCRNGYMQNLSTKCLPFRTSCLCSIQVDTLNHVAKLAP